MKSSLGDQIRDFYQNQDLTEAQLKTLENYYQHPKIKRFPRLGVPLTLGGVAAVILAMTLWRVVAPSDDFQKVAMEVSKNHLKDRPVDVVSSSYREINKALARLDFAIDPKSQWLQGLKLEGARYCSVSGKIAAQLKYSQPATGHRTTVFAFRATPPFVDFAMKQTKVRDLSVKIWTEGEVSYAMVMP